MIGTTTVTGTATAIETATETAIETEAGNGSDPATAAWTRGTAAELETAMLPLHLHLSPRLHMATAQALPPPQSPQVHLQPP